MKPTKNHAGRILILGIVASLCLVFVSWQTNQGQGKSTRSTTDTIPKNQPRNLDEVLLELENLDFEEEMKKAQVEMEKALREIDADKIRLQIEGAMAGLDFNKIQKELEESLAKMDFDKMKIELKDAVDKIDFEKIEREIRDAMKEIDMDKIKLEIEKAKSIDMKEMQEDLNKAMEELKNIQPKLKEDLAKAKVEIEKAKVEIKEYKEFVDGLEKEGLINKKEGFTLEYADGKLLINGKPAPVPVYSKYASFLQKHKKFRLVQNEKEFDLDND